MKLSTLLISSLSLIFLISGCNQQQSANDQKTDENTLSSQQNGFHVSGVASKGPIQNATVEIFNLDNIGQQTGSAIASTTTNANGQWQVTFSTAPTQATLIKVSGGSYIDEADPADVKRTIELDVNESLKGVLFAGFSTASVTILTNALLEKSKIETTSNNFFDVLNNNRNTAKLALGFDPFTVTAADPLSPSTSASIDSIEYAMYLGGVATALNSAAIILGKPVPDYAIMMGMVDDLSDGSLNGKKQNTTVQVSINSTLTDFPDNIDLNLAIQRFRNNNFAAYSVTEVQEIVEVDEAVLSVLGTNVAPTAIDDTATTVTNVSINLNDVLINDTDADGDQLSVVSFTQPSNGTVVEISNGVFSFTPAASFIGNTVFSYTASDNRGGEASAQVIIAVTDAPVVNPPPSTQTPPTAVAGDDQTSVEQAAITLTGSGSDADGVIDSFLWTQISGSSVSLTGGDTATATFTTPVITQVDVLVFSLTVTDNDGLIGIDTVSVVITPVNATPSVTAVVEGSSAIKDEKTDVTLTGTGVDTDGTIASYLWNQVTGTAVTIGDPSLSSITFTLPDIAITEALVFSLTVTDNEGAVSIATVNFIVNSINLLPVIDPIPVQSIYELSEITLTGSALDNDGTITSFQWSQVSGTDVALINENTANATFTSPLVTINNVDVLVFQLKVTDNEGAFALGFATVVTNPVLIAPTADAGIDQTLNEASTGGPAVIVNLDGSASLDDGSIAGFSWAQIAGTPTVTLSDSTIATPDFSAPGIANDSTFTFELTVTDDEGGIATDTVDINLVSLNSGPNLIDDLAAVTDEDTALLMTTLLNNDSDPEGDALTINTVTQPTNGSVVIETGNTSVTYTPDLNFNGSDSFTYTAVDAFGANSTSSATVTITINPVNDDPVAVNDVGSVTQGFPITFSNLTTNDTDNEGDFLTISGGLATQATSGIAINNGDGTITYTPDLNFNGSDFFEYGIVDGNGGSAIGRVDVTVIADTDGDGVIDTDEVLDGTNPTLADSDTDGFFDGHEKAFGSNPNLNSSFPATTTISATNSNNIINVNTTWSLDNAPYHVIDDVSVLAGFTLTIEAGVVVKFNSNADIFVNASGTLNVLGNAPEPQQVRLTSILDDSLNGDTAAIVGTPGAGSWSGIDYQTNSDGVMRNASVRYAVTCVEVSNTSIQIINVEAGDCSSYGFRIIASVGSITSFLHDITLIDFDTNGTSTGNAGIRVESTSSHTNTLDMFNLNLDEAGSTFQDGIEIVAASNSNITGFIDQIAITNVGDNAISLTNFGTGTVDPVISNMTVTTPGTRGIFVNNTSSGTLSPVFDGTNSIIGSNPGDGAIQVTNASPIFATTGSMTIDGGNHGLTLNNAMGEYNNISMTNLSTAGIRLLNNTAPTIFSNVTLTSSPAPFSLEGQALPANILAGTSYDSSVPALYMRFSGSVSAVTDLSPDPLGNGVSVWRFFATVTVASTGTLNINPGTIIKLDSNVIIHISSGGNLNILGNAGNRVTLTSIRDDSIGGDTNGGDSSNATTLPAPGNWAYIAPNTGSNIDVNFADINYSQYATWTNNPASYSIADTTINDFSINGLALNSSSTGATITYNLSNIDFTHSTAVSADAINVNAFGTPVNVVLNFDNITMTNIGDNITGDHGLEMLVSNSSTLTGTISNLTINDIGASAIFIDDRSTGVVNPTFNGLSITGPFGRNGIQFIGDATTIPTINGVNGLNTVTGGNYNLTLQGVSGNYSNLALDNPNIASMFIDNDANPASFDSNTVTLTNSASPYRLLSDLPASIGTLGIGSVDLGYSTATPNTLVENYIETAGTITNLTLMEDPLNNGSSVWVVPATLTVPALVSLEVTDNAVVKFANNIVMQLSGSLSVPISNLLNPAIFTSTLDDSVGGDSLSDGATIGSPSDWAYIQLNHNGSVNVDNAIFRFMDYAIFSSNASPTLFSISNTTITDYQQYGLDLNPAAGAVTYTLSNVNINNGISNDGIRVFGNTGDIITVDFSNLGIDNIGNDINDHGIDFDINNDATLTGTVSTVTISNTVGNGIMVDNSGSGMVDPVFSALTINDAARNSFQVIGNTVNPLVTAPIIDASVAANFFGTAGTVDSGGGIGLVLNAENGNYSDITINETTSASLHFSNNSTPTFGANIVLDNSPSPYQVVGMALPSGVSYTAGSTALIQDYARLSGALVGDLTLVTDPLGAGTFWRVTADLDVTSGNTLTIQAGTILKFDEFFQLEVLSGGTLSVSGVSGNEVIMTSFTDNNVGVANSALNFDWEGVLFSLGSLGGTIDFLDVWYARDGIDINNAGTGLFFNDLTVNYSQEGVRLNASSTTVAPTFNNLAINECSSTHLSLLGSNTMSPTFSGNLTITDISGANGTTGISSSSADTTTISGFTITGSNTGINISGSTGANRFENNIIRQAATRGIYNTADGTPWIRNNIIVNNGNNTEGAGIYIQSGNGIIFGNLIRNNRANWGGGIYINSSSPTIENNLIVNNHATSGFGGSGIYVFGTSSPVINNNTIANNTADDVENEGAGLTIDAGTGNITLIDNILFGNTEGDGDANDIYDEPGNIMTHYNNLVGTINPGSGINLYSSITTDVGANITNDIVGFDPLFIDGWYLSVLALGQSGDSPAIDVGSVNADSVLPFDLALFTTRTDGGNDGTGADLPLVNIGYHYPGGASVVDSSTTVVTPATMSVVGSVSVVLTVTPRDAGSLEIGAGLNVIATAAVSPSSLSNVTDLGNGSYQVTYLTPVGQTGTDTVNFTVNGVVITGNTVISWIP